MHRSACCRVQLPTTCRLQSLKEWLDQAIANFEAEQKLPSADTNTGHGNDEADTELDREVRGEIESLVKKVPMMLNLKMMMCRCPSSCMHIRKARVPVTHVAAGG